MCQQRRANNKQMTPIIYAYQLTYLDTSVFAVFAYPRKRQRSSNTCFYKNNNPRAFRVLVRFLGVALSGKSNCHSIWKPIYPICRLIFKSICCVLKLYTPQINLSIYFIRKKVLHLCTMNSVRKWKNRTVRFKMAADKGLASFGSITLCQLWRVHTLNRTLHRQNIKLKHNRIKLFY